MKFWVPAALTAVIVLSYAFFYFTSEGGGSASSFGLANTVGLAAVFLGLIGAGLLLRRATPPQ